MADGRHFEKLLNRHNSAMVQRIAMKFCTMTHFNPLQPTHYQKISIEKNPRLRTVVILKKSSYLRISLTDRYELLQNDEH